ncbi:MAG: FkbM family methyltransferase [Campylobacterota bacterium]|nr:FkbM family methyltransferase [Campylobacterota bacterium]
MLKNKLVQTIYRMYPLKRGKRFLRPLYQLIGGYEIIKDNNNNKVLLNLENYIDSIIYFEGSYESVHLKILYDMYIDNKCNYFIDIGANIGVYSVPFLKSTNTKQCFLFEPDPNNFAQLNANVFLNKVSEKAILHNCALSNSNTKGKLYISDEKKDIDLGKVNAGTHSLDKNNSRHGKEIEVNIYRTDELINLKNEIICFKIDVEGHELNVLKGLKKLIDNNKCIIMVEIFKSKFNIVNEYLNKNNFKQINLLVNIGDNYLYKNFEK